MRYRNLFAAIGFGLCVSGSALAATVPVTLTFDEYGNSAVTGDGPSESGTSGSGQFDTMGSTLQYTLPSTVTNTLYSSSNGAWREAIILTAPGNANLVASVIILDGSNGTQLTVYNNNSTYVNSLLVKNYAGPNGSGTYNSQTPLGLAADLELQNTSPNLVGAFFDFLVIPEATGDGASTVTGTAYVATEAPPIIGGSNNAAPTFDSGSWTGSTSSVTVSDSLVNFDGHQGIAYSYTPTSSDFGGSLSYDASSTDPADPFGTLTFITAVPLPNTAATLAILLGLMGTARYLRFIPRRSIIAG